MLRLKQKQSHTQNSVDRPQNRHLKPFKSRAELNGQIDPRINVGGRPKIIREVYEKVLHEKTKVKVVREDGKEEEVVVPRYEAMARSQIDVACSTKPHSVAAAREIRQIVEPTEAGESQASSDKAFIRMLAECLLEKKADAIEV